MAKIKAYNYDINFRKKMKKNITAFVQNERKASVEKARSIN